MKKIIISGEHKDDPTLKDVIEGNLNKIQEFCENSTVCRRQQMLQYFNEDFCADKCLENRETACDVCLGEVELPVKRPEKLKPSKKTTKTPVKIGSA